MASLAAVALVFSKNSPRGTGGGSQPLVASIRYLKNGVARGGCERID
jgi:hypothetical protein